MSYIGKNVIVTRTTEQFKEWFKFTVWYEVYIEEKKQYCLYEKSKSWKWIYEKNIRILK